MKALTPVKKICEGLPIEFLEVLTYCRNCKDSELLNYEEIRDKFKKLYFKNYEKWDQVYDWDYLNNNLLEVN